MTKRTILPARAAGKNNSLKTKLIPEKMTSRRVRQTKQRIRPVRRTMLMIRRRPAILQQKQGSLPTVHLMKKLMLKKVM